MDEGVSRGYFNFQISGLMTIESSIISFVRGSLNSRVSHEL